MSWPSYPNYKASGVEWLGEIPKGWRVEKYRYCFRESAEKNGQEPVGPMLSVSGYRGVEVKHYDDDNKRRTVDELEDYRVVRVGQLAVNTMWLNYAGLGVSQFEGHISPAYRAYWISPQFDGRFVHHLMRSTLYVQGYTAQLTGVRPNSLQMSRDSLMGFPILQPSFEEQRTIADFLDRETAKIDALIDKQDQLVATLREDRTATITHAVTKGLDPDAEMKDSGVQWIGELPRTWTAQRLSWLFNTISSGTTPSGDRPEYYGGDINWVTTGELRESVIVDTVKKVTRQALVDHSALVVHPTGALLIAMYGATIGRLGFLGAPACTNQACCVFVGPTTVETKFAFYALSAGREHLILIASGGGQPNINQDKLRSLRIALPPMTEQRAIVDYLDAECIRIDALVEKATGVIAILREYRSALITAAVTGKIDVREVV